MNDPLAPIRATLRQDHEAIDAELTTAADWIRAHFERDVIARADQETVRALSKLAMSALAQVWEGVKTERVLMNGLRDTNAAASRLIALVEQQAEDLRRLRAIVAAEQEDTDGPLLH